MSEVMRLCADEDKVECADCDWKGLGHQLHFMADFEDRVYAGETLPAGQCPKCGTLAYLTTEQKEPNT